MSRAGNQKFNPQIIPQLFSNRLRGFILIGPPAQNSTDQFGWTLVMHSYSYQKSSIFNALDRAAALGVNTFLFRDNRFYFNVALDRRHQSGDCYVAVRSLVAGPVVQKCGISIN